MNCPVCDLEMIPGYLNCGAALWSDHKHKMSLIPKQTERYALYLGTPMLTAHTIESYCCPKCKRIILNGAGYPNNLMWVDTSRKMP